MRGSYGNERRLSLWDDNNYDHTQCFGYFDEWRCYWIFRMQSDTHIFLVSWLYAHIWKPRRGHGMHNIESVMDMGRTLLSATHLHDTSNVSQDVPTTQILMQMFLFIYII